MKSHLEESNIREFKSLKEVISFRGAYPTLRQQLIAEHEELIEQEKSILNAHLPQLDLTIETKKHQEEQRLTNEIAQLKQQLTHLTYGDSTNLFQRLQKNLKQWIYKRQVFEKERNFDKKVAKSISELVELSKAKKHRLQFITSQFDTAVEESARSSLWEIDRKKSVIEEASNLIYGALGEQMVVKTLEALPDEYFLINDFAVSFSPAIYDRQENDYIKSVQIDHLLVARSGIFLIETKNWSDKSIANLGLRSPVEQIKRTSFVLFKLLNNEISNHHLGLDKHHWGEKRISIKSLIVLTNTKPKEEFQYVKVLSVGELLGYVKYFKPIFTGVETQRIAEFLLRIADEKTIETK
ncbi:nuclease-related domain-containing protein [Pedobacter sp. SYSU D00535]|uniref:nuclease-related domain-containing protein n=1 Tax=Pedobacter sp. SYSU D00535 TaxID=2810308 RepID=UPI001A960C1F|nr:nuclease-related domain-containing protein [Pedobacter sp. SYSU D00535]